MSALGSWATDLACVGGIVALAVTHAIEGKLAMMGVLMIAAGRLRPPPPSLNGDLTLGGVGTIALAGGTALVRVVRRWFRV